MVTLKTLDSSIISFIILFFIYTNAYRRSDKAFTSNKLFISLVAANMLMIVIDILGWAFNGLPGPANQFLNEWSNVLLYICTPVVASLWVLYIHYQVYQDDRKLEKTKRVLIGLIVLNAALSIASVYTGWYFTFDAGNVYRRAGLFFIHAVYNYALLVYSFCFIMAKRKMIDKRHFYSLLLFFAPPLAGMLAQTFYYGVSYIWSGMMLSMLIIYFNIQDRGLNTDYLTGAYNRRQLDGYLKARIRNSTEGNSFSAILFDLDEFKQINDRFGHDAGDEALKDAVGIIRGSLRQDDIIARIGGDEFIAVIDLDNRSYLTETVKRIKEAVQAFNRSGTRPYSINFSMGYDIYDPGSRYAFDDFFKHIDMLMYNDKKAKQDIQA
jgi:diguanylate cyclase (GGDEF)-like protein